MKQWRWCELQKYKIKWIYDRHSCNCSLSNCKFSCDSHVKGAGMLVVSLSDANFGFWSHLGCSGQNATIFSHKGCARRNIKIYIFFNSFCLLHSCNQSLKWSLLEVKNGWATPKLATFTRFLQNFRRASQLPFYVVVPLPSLPWIWDHCRSWYINWTDQSISLTRVD